MILHLDTVTFIVTDEKDRVVSLDNAKAFWSTGKVSDCNLAFQRLANLDWDIDKLDGFYHA